MNYYGVCFVNGDGLSTVEDPKHNRYPGYVYGTLKKHPNTTSAIEEYRKFVQTKYPDARSAEDHALSSLIRIHELESALSSLEGKIKDATNSR